MSQIIFRLFCSSLLISGVALHPKAFLFEPAELVSAADDLRYPIHSTAVGTVVLEMTISEKGTVENVRIIREIPSLTEAAVESVRKWQFKPAISDGKPTRSRAVSWRNTRRNREGIPIPLCPGYKECESV
jgi:TonB family protein